MISLVPTRLSGRAAPAVTGTVIATAAVLAMLGLSLNLGPVAPLAPAASPARADVVPPALAWEIVDGPLTLDTFVDVAMVGADDGWAISVPEFPFEQPYRSRLWRYREGGWHEHATWDDETFSRVTMLSETDGWLIGSTLLRWNGETWRPWRDESLRSPYFTDISMLSAEEGYLVTSGGELHLWDGVVWHKGYEFHDASLYAIDTLPTGEIYVGGGPSSFFAVWDGSTWREVDLGSNSRIAAIEAVAADDVWVSAESGRFWHWDGAEWADLPRINVNGTRDFLAFSPTDIWAVGAQGFVSHWDGDEWEVVWHGNQPGLGGEWETLKGVSGSASDLWAVGEQGLIVHWDGTRWTPIERPRASGLRDVDMLSSDEGWAVGDAARILRWDGRGWNEVPSPVEHGTLFAVSMSSATNGWAIGWESSWIGDSQRVYLRWDGIAWRKQAVDFAEPDFFGGITDVVATGPRDAWMVGDVGVILRWDGETWSRVPRAERDIAYYTVDASGPEDVWAMGDITVRWDGESWSRVHAFDEVIRVLDVDIVAPGHGWAAAVGNDSLWRLHEGRWTRHENPMDQVATKVAASIGGPAWAASDSPYGGGLVTWDGEAWQLTETPSELTGALDAVSDTEVWSVGPDGTIMRARDRCAEAAAALGPRSPCRTYLPAALQE